MEYRSSDVHVKVQAPISAAAREILTPDALQFVGTLCAKFEDRRRTLLEARAVKAVEYDAGVLPTFLDQNSPAVSDPNWRCASIPEDVKDRRVEITGPIDRKMVINGLNRYDYWNVYIGGCHYVD